MNIDFEPLQAEVSSSLASCLEDPDFYDRFYRIFFEHQPEARKRFQEVDMALQKRRLADTLPRFLGLVAPEDPFAYTEHRSRHGELSSTQYRAWFEALGAALKEHNHELRGPLSEALDRLLYSRLTAILKASRAAPQAPGASPSPIRPNGPDGLDAGA